MKLGMRVGGKADKAILLNLFEKLRGETAAR
jgi:hypothetical protein